MPIVDLCFEMRGTGLPLDHRYSLYAAISGVLGPLTHESFGMAFSVVHATRTGADELRLARSAHLRIRTPLEHLPSLLRLSGCLLNVSGHKVRLGVPRTFALRPVATLYSSLVTIKGFTEPEPFLAAAHRQLEALDVKGAAIIPLRQEGAHAGEPTRRVLRIKDKRIVGFALLVSELAAADSILLQERGIGGRRHMGCGVFVPARAAGAQGEAAQA